MNQHILVATGASLLIAGCAQSSILSAPGCQPYRVESQQCQGNANSPIVELDLDTMTVDKPYVCARRTRIIVFKIDPAPDDDGTVAIVPKQAADTWLVGTNSASPQIINVKVPHWVTAGDDYKYSIITADGRCLDPRVRVTN